MAPPPRNAVFASVRHDIYAAHAYSVAIRSGDLLFVSGQVGSRSDGSPEPDFEAQVRLAFANLKAILKAGGCGLDDIVDLTSFHTDPEHQFPYDNKDQKRSLPDRALSKRNGSWRQLARGVRFRDQGDRADP